MADVESNINVNIDTSNALAAIKRLQSEISAFHTSMARGGAQAAATSSQLQKELVNSLNATGNFSAGFRNVKSSADAFTTSLEKNKFSLGEYFKYAGASTKTFGKVFQTEMATIDKVARERVKDLQTQYIKLGTEANGAIKTIAIRPLTLDLQDLGTKTAIAAQKQQLFNELMRQGSTNLLNFGKNTQWAGRQLMVGFSIPLGIAGAAAAREFMKLEEQAIRFKRVYGDTFTPTGETDKMVEEIKGLANAYTTYGLAVEKTMSLAADAAAMGKTGADLLAQVDQASKLAVLGGVDQQKALETTISLTSAFGTATRDLAKDINFLNAVENQTVTSIEDLTTAIPTAAPVIQQLGGDVKDLAFFLTAMREGGINASEGANALKSGLASMINPTTAATEMLAKFGVNLQGIVDGNKGNVKQMIVDLGLALDGLDPTNRAQAIEQLFGKFQFARMSTLFQNVIKDGTQAGRVLELTARSAVELSILSEREMKKVADSPMFKFQAALEKFQAALAPVGEAFLKLITPIIEWGKQLLDGFNSWGDGAKNFTMLIVGAVAGLGPILLMGFGLIANGAANLIKGLMGLFNFFKRLGGQSKVLGEQTKYMSQEQINAMAAAASLEQAHNSLTQAFTSERAAIRQLITAYEQASVAQGRFMSAPVNRGTVGRTAPVKKASGGIISGPGTGTSDSIPAMLSNGEAVIPAKQVAANRSLVEGLIAGNVPGFSKGGIVGNPLMEIFKRFKKSKRSKMPVTDFGELISPSKGHSFPDFESNPYGNKAMGGLYRKPDGSLVFVKPQMDERGAVAELRATQIAREAHGLKTPQQSLRVMKDPNDEKGQRKVFALESPFDEALANPTGTFTKEEMGKQLVASLLRGDKDLSQSNMYSNVLADVGTAGVFDRASGFRDFAPQMPTMEEQANINLLAVRGGAKRAFAESTADIAKSMTPQQYNDMIVSEIDTVLPKLQQTIASFGLTDPQEIAAYQKMVDRLREGRNVDWSKFHGIHSAVQPKPQKLARGTSRVTKKPVARGYDFDDTLVNLSSFLPGHREANAKLPKEQRKSWGWEAIKGAAPMPKVIQNLLDSQAAGKKIIIMTARPNTMDPMTTAHLKALGINPKNVKLISRDIADKSLSGLSTAELKAVQAKNVMDEYDLEAFFDDMEDNRNAVAGLGVNVFDPLKFASGSQMVPGTGNKDTVPALLTPGEAVIPKKQAEKYRPLIRGMIAGNLPGYKLGTDEVGTEELIGRIVSKAATGSQARLQEQLSDSLGKAIELGLTDGLHQALAQFEQAEAKPTRDKLKKFFTENDLELGRKVIAAQLGQAGSISQQHVGATREVSPAEARQLVGTPSSKEKNMFSVVEKAQSQGFSPKLTAESSFFFDQLMAINSAMKNGNAKIQEVLADWDRGGLEKWRATFEMAEEAFDDPQLQEEIKQYDATMRKYIAELEAAQLAAGKSAIISDTDLDKVHKKAMAEMPENRAKAAIRRAENTVGGFRVSWSTKEQQQYKERNPEDAALVDAAMGSKPGKSRTTNSVRSTLPRGPMYLDLQPGDFSTPEGVKAARTAGKKAVKEQKDAFNEGAKEEGGVASPAKVPKKVGAAHSEGFTEGAKEGIAKAKSAGEAIANRKVNTNPAFGRVPQVAPVVSGSMKAFIEQQSKKMMSSGAIATLLASASPIQKLNGDFSIMGTNIKNMSAQLQLARSPITMLQNAATSAKNGLVAAAMSMKDFSINAATKVSTSVKNMTISAQQAAIGIANSAKQIAAAAAQSAGSAIKAAPGKIGEFVKSGKGAGIGMGASMGLMMAQGVEGPVGQIAGALSGPMMILSTVGPMLAMLPGPLMAVVAVLGVFAVAIGVSIQQYNDGIKKAVELGNALGTSAKSLKSFAEATGNVTAGEIEMRNRSERQGGVSTSGKITFGQAYLEQGENKQQVAATQESINKVGKSNAENLLVSRMANAVASGAMNAVDARSVVSAIATEMGDTTFGMDVNGKLLELLGPNGEDLTKDPIGVRIKIIEETEGAWQNVIDSIEEAKTVESAASDILGKPIDETKTKKDGLGQEFYDSEGNLVGKKSTVVGIKGSVSTYTDASGKVVQSGANVGTTSAGAVGYEGATYAQAFSSQLSSIQQALASAKPGEDTSGIIAKQQELYGQVATVTPQLDKGRNDAMVEGFKQNIAGRYEGDTGQQQNASNVANNIIGNANATQTQEAQLLVNLGSDTGLDPATMANMMKIFGGSTESIQQMLDLQINMDPAQYADLSSVYSQFTDNPEMVQKFQTDVFVKQDKAGQQAITNSLTQISKANSDPKIRRLQLETVMKDKSGATLRLINKRVNDLKKQPKISLQFLADTNGIDTASAEFQELKAKWDAIPEKDQASFAMNFTTNFTTTGDKNNPAYLKWLETNKGKSIVDFAASEAQTSITTSTDDTDVSDTGDDDTGDTSGGGGGGSPEPPPRTVVDVIADQQKRITAIGDQTSAVRKLVAAGLSLADAYAIASNAEDAALIAREASTEQLAELVAKTREAEKATKDLAAAQSVSNSLMETKDKNALAAKLAADKTLTDTQKTFLLQNADAARLYMTPTLDPAALNQALIDAQNAKTYEFNINKVTIPGLQDIWQKGMSNAAAAFSAQQNVIELNFKVQKDPLKDIVEAGQRAISDIQNRAGGLDDLDADLQRIAAKEFEINKAYDEKAKALNEVSRINDRIISQQKSQLGLANALSTGDIAAAARAAQDMQAQGSLNSIADQRTALDEARKAEIEGLTGTSGLTREQIEEKIRDLKAQILEIEEKRVEPAQRQMELLDRMQQDQIDALVVLGKTKDEWNSINASLELANTKTYEFQESMRQALSIATQLGAALAGATVQSVYTPPPPPPAPPPAPAATGRSAAWLNDMAQRVMRGEFGNGQARRNALGADYAAVQAIVDTYYSKGGLVSYMKKGGMMSYMNSGGMVPYMAMGGIANMLAKGTDTIPAMLTAGEFVMSKPAVDKLGAGRLAELNRGYDRNSNNRFDSVYNYSISVNASTNANPREIANTVLAQIKQVDAQRIRSNRF